MIHKIKFEYNVKINQNPMENNSRKVKMPWIIHSNFLLISSFFRKLYLRIYIFLFSFFILEGVALERFHFTWNMIRMRFLIVFLLKEINKDVLINVVMGMISEISIVVREIMSRSSELLWSEFLCKLASLFILGFHSLIFYFPFKLIKKQ